MSPKQAPNFRGKNRLTVRNVSEVARLQLDPYCFRRSVVLRARRGNLLIDPGGCAALSSGEIGTLIASQDVKRIIMPWADPLALRVLYALPKKHGVSELLCGHAALPLFHGKLQNVTVRVPADVAWRYSLDDNTDLSVIPVDGVGAGSFALFYPTAKVLFTGPLFGVLSADAGEDQRLLWWKMALFHEAYLTAAANLSQACTEMASFHPELLIPSCGPAFAPRRKLSLRTLAHEFPHLPYTREAEKEGQATLRALLQDVVLRAFALLGPDAAPIVHSAGISWSPATYKVKMKENSAVQPQWEQLLGALTDARERGVTALSYLFEAIRQLAATADVRVAGPSQGRIYEAKSTFQHGTNSAQQAATPAAQGNGDHCRITDLPRETLFRKRMAARLKITESDPECSLLIISLDNAQRINSNYGRVGGDEALHAVSYLLRNIRSRQAHRKKHEIYRYAGPTFAYIIPDPTDDASEIAEEIRQHVAESVMFLEPITVSVGVAACHEATRPGVSPEQRVQNLERISLTRLQIARASGMNTVCFSAPVEVGSNPAHGTILIVDPDSPDLQILIDQLQFSGYTVITVADGLQAMETISQISPDVIIAEAMTPRLNGFVLRDRLRHSASLNTIPYILISQKKSDEYIQRASRLGILHFLQKPVSLVELRGLVENLTDSEGV